MRFDILRAREQSKSHAKSSFLFFLKCFTQASSGNKANDREEIRRRLAMGDAEDDVVADYYCGERVARKPNLATRLKYASAEI